MVTQVIANRVYDFSHCIGGRDMLKPSTMALGPGNIVYLVNLQVTGLAQIRAGHPDLPQIKKIDTGDAPGEEEYVAEFGYVGCGVEDVYWASDLACDSTGNVYVADGWLNRISVFDEDGRFLRSWGQQGSGEGQLLGPCGLQFDARDILHVVDGRNHRVQKFTRDGEYDGGWGSHGNGPGQFDSPWGLTIDGEGFVYVADHRNDRVQKLTPDGEAVQQFGSTGTRVGELRRPSDVAVDPDGDVYVCDWANSRVNIYDPSGRPITALIGDAVQLSKWQQQFVDSNIGELQARRRARNKVVEWRFALPTAVEFHAGKAWLFVSDYQRGRFQIYAKLHDYDEPQFNL